MYSVHNYYTLQNKGMWLCLKTYRKWYLWIRVMVIIHWLRWLIDKHVQTGLLRADTAVSSQCLLFTGMLRGWSCCWTPVFITETESLIKAAETMVAVDTCPPFCSSKRPVNQQPGKDTTLLVLLIWENWPKVLCLTAPKPHIRAESGVSLFLRYYVVYMWWAHRLYCALGLKVTWILFRLSLLIERKYYCNIHIFERSFISVISFYLSLKC